jgi:phytoene dehydrogenase-like protein
MPAVAQSYDAVVVGAGPNGLGAAIELARSGRSVLVVEGQETIGGGAKTREVTLPGFHHDLCSAIHPTAVVSPLFRTLPLADFGLEWVYPPAALANPFDDGDAALLYQDLDATAATLDPGDGDAWSALMGQFLHPAGAFFDEILRPVRIPSRPLLLARFGLQALRSSAGLVRSRFRGRKARALFTGCAAHCMVPLERKATASFGLVLALSGHAIGWPMAKGGSESIIKALAAYLQSLGGEIRTSFPVASLDQLPPSRAVLLDVTPRQLFRIAGDRFTASYRRQLQRFRYGPGVFKVDWALDGPIPWRAAAASAAATVHLGPSAEEIERGERESWRGQHSEKPFVLVAQQSLFDPTRAPAGKHTGWAYCHVPNGSTVDMTAAIEAQMERFAPGFRDLILGRATINAVQMEAHNPNMIGGDIGQGANDIVQTLMRPFVRWNPYSTPDPRIFLCSSSTPPGGGVHGMCGYWAARSALRSVLR